MYNKEGRAVLDVQFDNRLIIYDVNSGAIFVPEHGLEFDFADYQNDDETKAYMNRKPVRLTLTHRSKKKMHYMV